MRRLPAASVVVSIAVAAGCSPSPSSPPPPSSPATVPTSASMPPSAEVSTSASSSTPSSSKKASAPLPDAATILKEASAAADGLISVRLALVVLGDITRIPLKSLHADLTRQPSPAANGGARVALGDGGIDVKFVVFDGDFFAAVPGKEWVDYGPAAGVYDPTAVLDTKTGLAQLLNNFVDPGVEDRETIGDQHTVRVAGEITADAANGIAPQLAASKRMRCTVWIQETGERQLVQLKLSPAENDSVQMLFSNWNAPVSVDKPLP